ncbi:hypothetical protein F4802DRAFT_578511 [Xylaria palmicola]|nr:hypothetical protein F4802DRAFT_578511 [Xylaria palmicola]
MKLIAFAKSLWTQLSEKQNVSVPFLQLPVQLYDHIATFLAPADIVLLSQTCRSIRVSLFKHPSGAHLSRADYFAYLAGMAHGLPDQWVCDYCMALHPVNKRDTPTAACSPCPCPAESRGPPLHNPCLLRIDHHHVQLALKYTRLQLRKHDPYLQALLEPRLNSRFRTYACSYITHEARYSAYPRIAIGSDGNPRFLLFSTWRYIAGGRDLMLHNLGYQWICPHLEFRGDDYFQHDNDLFRAFRLALHPGGAGKEWRNACSRCTTDFSVMRCGASLYLRVWQDFGPEGSPLDPVWRSQSTRPGLDGVENSEGSGPTLYHEPGSIAKLYCGHRVVVSRKKRTPLLRIV